MRNKEIYQHIADTYMGQSTGPKKTNKKKWIFHLAVICGLILVSGFFLARNVVFHSRNKGASIYLLSERYPLKLSYDLELPNLGIKNFSFSLPQTDASKYSKLKLRIRGDKAASYTKVLKLELVNATQERDYRYIEDISDKWRDFSIELGDFKNIRDWSSINHISFIFEDWNISAKSGIIYIDNLRFSE